MFNDALNRGCSCNAITHALTKNGKKLIRCPSGSNSVLNSCRASINAVASISSKLNTWGMSLHALCMLLAICLRKPDRGSVCDSRASVVRGGLDTTTVPDCDIAVVCDTTFAAAVSVWLLTLPPLLPPEAIKLSTSFCVT